MTKIILVSSTILLTSCFSGPEFVPSNRVDSPMTLNLKKDASSNSDNYGWLFWYIPIASIAIMWSYREFIKLKSVKNG